METAMSFVSARWLFHYLCFCKEHHKMISLTSLYLLLRFIVGAADVTKLHEK